MDNEPSYLFSSGLATILYQSEAEQAEQCIVFCQGSWGGALNPLLWEATAIQSFALHFNNTSSARFTASSVIHYPPNASKKLMRGDRHIILSEAQLTQAPSCSVRSSLWEWLESAQHENATQDRSNIYTDLAKKWMPAVHQFQWEVCDGSYTSRGSATAEEFSQVLSWSSMHGSTLSAWVNSKNKKKGGSIFSTHQSHDLCTRLSDGILTLMEQLRLEIWVIF